MKFFWWAAFICGIGNIIMAATTPIERWFAVVGWVGATAFILQNLIESYKGR